MEQIDNADDAEEEGQQDRQKILKNRPEKELVENPRQKYKPMWIMNTI